MRQRHWSAMRYARAFLAALALIVTAQGSWAQSANIPIGNRDDYVPSGNTYFTWGWTCDPDNWPLSLWVHFYVDGTYDTGTFAGAVQATTERPDVAGACNGTTAHGYGFYIPSQFMTPGTHSIYAYALDNGGIGPNPLLGASPLSYTVFTISGNAGSDGVTVTGGSTSTSSDSSGNYTLAVVSGSYAVSSSKSGCTFSPGSQSVSVGPSVSGINFSASCGTATTYSISGQTNTPYAVVNIGGLTATADATGAYSISGLNAGSYTVSPSGAAARCHFEPASLSVSVGPSRTGADFTTICEKTWDPLITNASAAQYRECNENGTCTNWGSGAPTWTFSNSNEVQVPPDSPTHPVASLPVSDVDNYILKMFEQKPSDGRWKVKLGINKEWNNRLLNLRDGSALGNNQQVWFDTTYATAFFEDNFDVNKDYQYPNSPYAYPTLDEDLWVDMGVALLSYHAASDGDQPHTPAGLMPGFSTTVKGMSRVTLGITVSWGSEGPRFLEIDLWRDPAYDACNASAPTWWGKILNGGCYDTTDVFDRRASWNTGENVYLYGPALGWLYQQIGLDAPTPSSLTVGGAASYSLPIGALFRWYFGPGGPKGLAGPANWHDAIIHGVYIGIETWGRATTNVDIDNYRLYSAKGEYHGNTALPPPPPVPPPPPPPSATNVALASNGATASASSTGSNNGYFPVDSLINGDRAGYNWGNGGGWRDSTAFTWPDWVEIHFAQTKTIDRVILYSMQDNNFSPVEPTDSMTFANYGAVDFVVEGWTGSGWTTLGTVTNNNLVKRTVSFAAYSTDRIRVSVTRLPSGANYTRLVEIEAWTP